MTTADDIKRLVPSIMNAYKTMFIVNVLASGKSFAEGTIERAQDAWQFCIRGTLRDLGMYYVFLLFECEDIGFIGKVMPTGLGRSSRNIGYASSSTPPVNKLKGSNKNAKSSISLNSDLKDRSMEKALELEIEGNRRLL